MSWSFPWTFKYKLNATYYIFFSDCNTLPLSPFTFSIIIWYSVTSWEIDGEAVETVSDFIFWGSKITADADFSHEIKRRLKPRQHIKKQRHYFANKGPSSQGSGFSCGHVWMRELDCEKSWALNNWCFLHCGVGEDSWESLGL